MRPATTATQRFYLESFSLCLLGLAVAGIIGLSQLDLTPAVRAGRASANPGMTITTSLDPNKTQARAKAPFKSERGFPIHDIKSAPAATLRGRPR